MLYAHVADVIEIVYVVLLGKSSALLTLNSGFDVLVWRKVVHYKRYLALIKNLCKSVLVKLVYCNGTCDVVAQNHIQFSSYQLPLDNAV